MHTASKYTHTKVPANFKRHSGFTLIEVLVALVIVSFGIVSIIQVTSQHVNNISELEKRMVASWVASNHIAEIRHKAKVERLRSRSDSERFKMGGHEWRSSARLEETEVEKVFLVSVEVSFSGDPNKVVYASMTSAVTDRLP